jgi:hypothetical protein
MISVPFQLTFLGPKSKLPVNIIDIGLNGAATAISMCFYKKNCVPVIQDQESWGGAFKAISILMLGCIYFS